jgi:hypothetical protein
MTKGRVAAALSALLIGQSAHAGYVFNYTITPGVGALAGDNVFKFYARNDQTGDQAGSKSMIAAKVRYQSVGTGQPLVFEFKDLNSDGVPDANIEGIGMSEAKVTGTFLRIESTTPGALSDWSRAFSTPAGHMSRAGVVPTVNYASVIDFNAEGAELRRINQNDWADATQGLGRFYGAAVVPAGTDVKVSGMVAAEKGGIVSTGATAAAMALLDDAPLYQSLVDGAPVEGVPAAADAPLIYYPFSFVASAPEPATLGLLGIAIGATTLRRRARR